jgi:hypothetical protein
LALSEAAAPSCPSSDVHLLDVPFATGSFAVDAAAYDSTLEESGFLIAYAAFDLAAGTVAVIHGAIYPGPTTVTARDRFDVAGVPPGTSVDVTAELLVDGSVTTPGCGGSGCFGGIGAAVEANGMRVEEDAGGEQHAPGPVDSHPAPRLTVSIVAGLPVLIEFWLHGARAPGGDHRVEAAGTYRFVDLPPGVAVVSCRGLVGPATPARTASWGRLKAAYR